MVICSQPSEAPVAPADAASPPLRPSPLPAASEKLPEDAGAHEPVLHIDSRIAIIPVAIELMTVMSYYELRLMRNEQSNIKHHVFVRYLIGICSYFVHSRSPELHAPLRRSVGRAGRSRLQCRRAVQTSEPHRRSPRPFSW